MALLPRILLVDDDPALRVALAEVLAERGYDVVCASDGREALDLLERAAAPGVILLDLAMPVMDGWTFRAYQRHDPRFASIPTIVLSASLGAGDDAVDGLAPAAALSKPFDLQRLFETIQHVCTAECDHAAAGRSAAG